MRFPDGSRCLAIRLSSPYDLLVYPCLSYTLHSVDPCLYFPEIPDGGELSFPDGVLLVDIFARFLMEECESFLMVSCLVTVIHAACVKGDPVQLVPTLLSSRWRWGRLAGGPDGGPPPVGRGSLFGIACLAVRCAWPAWH